MLNFIDGNKNYIFGAIIIILGAWNYYAPAEMDLSIMGMTDPGSLVSTGIAWILGRNALKKIEGGK